MKKYQPILSVFAYKYLGTEFYNFSFLTYNAFKKRGNPMSCIYCHNTPDYVYLVSDSLNLRLNEKGDVVDKIYLRKITNREGLFASWGRSSFDYHGKRMEMPEIIMAQGTDIISGIESLKKDIVPQLKNEERWGLIYVFKKNNDAIINFYENFPFENGTRGEYSQDFSKGLGGIFAGTNYEVGRDLNLNAEINNGDINALKQMIRVNIAEDEKITEREPVIGGPIQIYRMDKSNGDIINLSEEPFNDDRIIMVEAD